MKATRVLGKMTSYEEIYYVGKINCIEAQSQAQTSWLPPHIFLSNFFEIVYRCVEFLMIVFFALSLFRKVPFSQ